MDSSIGNMETPGKMQRKNHWLRGHHLDKLQTQIICVAPVCLTLTLSLSLWDFASLFSYLFASLH